MTNQIQLEPETHAFAEAAARSPLLFTLGPEQGRLALDEVQSGKVRKPAVDVEDLTITEWVFGSPQTHDRLVRELAVGAGAAVVFPVYRLCPEVRYPTALGE